MNTTFKSLPFTQRQVIHCQTITLPKGQVFLWDIINTVLLQTYTTQELKDMGQGVVSKVKSIIKKVSQVWVVNSSPNLNKSVESNWNQEEYLWVSDLVSEDVLFYVKSLV